MAKMQRIVLVQDTDWVNGELVYTDIAHATVRLDRHGSQIVEVFSYDKLIGHFEFHHHSHHLHEGQIGCLGQSLVLWKPKRDSSLDEALNSGDGTYKP